MSLLGRAENELSKATKGVGSANVAADLRAKQELCSALRVATEEILKRLRFYTKELATVVPHGEKIFLTEVYHNLTIILKKNFYMCFKFYNSSPEIF